MRQNRLWILGVLTVGSMAALPACAGAADSYEETVTGDKLAPVAPPSAVAAATVEDFESGTKTAYAAANVTFASGTWNLDDALVGTLDGDVKNGGRATRVRNAGKVTMGFDRANAGTVTIKSATYGSDANGSWGLFYSRNQGSTWTQIGSAVTTAPNTLSTATFAVNQSGNVRLQVRKLDGGSNRIDVDDVSIQDYTGGGSDGGTDSGGGGGDGGSSGGGASLSVHTTLGIPSDANTNDPNDYLAVKSEYVHSYNSSRKIPNWVSWELNTGYLGSADRSNNYRPDDTLPSGMAQASLADYSGSGYDRGHICPSGDRTKSATANGITFFLSNMVPQAANNNRGPWEKLESYSRTLANSGKELFVIAGGVVTSSSSTIGSGVVVPDSTFKVVAVLDHVGAGAADVTTSTRIIAVLMPNDDSKINMGDDWKSFRVSARSIENATNLNFLSDVPQNIQDVIEARVDNQ
ncbi:DNA/RNA non-specific endonuclease [Pendulispora rubella]|uniref:DNA/RNA non-specific endonuclease n=1 Tax=Pendulispora rubella TaxID=2741070 RepID=A0ABZ2KVQ6_9BACT